MRVALLAGLIVSMAAGAAAAAEWQVEKVDTPARAIGIDLTEGVRVDAGGLWYRLLLTGAKPKLTFIEKTKEPDAPEQALPHGRIVAGAHDIARVWLIDPTTRYDHGILGDKVTAGGVVIETRDGKTQAVRLKDDAVFEDLQPRLADLDGDGDDEVVVVKSYLKRGSALVVIGRRDGKYAIIAETPPLGAPNRWLNPAGIADFNGDSKTDIALVRMPHVLGELELWTWSDKRLIKTAELADATNHIAGTRALDMSAVADFDGDGIQDLAIPSLDRTRLRLISFVPEAREIASIPLPAKAVTNLGLTQTDQGAPVIVLALENGTLVLVRRKS